MEPAAFDPRDPNRCLERIELDESGKPSQCVKDVFEKPHVFVVPLLEPEIRAKLRRYAGGDE